MNQWDLIENFGLTTVCCGNIHCTVKAAVNNEIMLIEAEKVVEQEAIDNLVISSAGMDSESDGDSGDELGQVQKLGKVLAEIEAEEKRVEIKAKKEQAEMDAQKEQAKIDAKKEQAKTKAKETNAVNREEEDSDSNSDSNDDAVQAPKLGDVLAEIEAEERRTEIEAKEKQAYIDAKEKHAMNSVEMDFDFISDDDDEDVYSRGN